MQLSDLQDLRDFFQVGDKVEDNDGDLGMVTKVDDEFVHVLYDFQDEPRSTPYRYNKVAVIQNKFLTKVGPSLTKVTSPDSPGGEIRVTDPLTGGQKGQKPEQYSLIPVFPLSEVARVYGSGAQKYSRDNWRKGYSWSLSIDALMRHIESFRNGEQLSEHGHHHLAHAAFHLFTLMEYDSKGLGTDDRGDLPQSVNRGGSSNVPG